MTAGTQIRRGRPEDLPLLEPLWVSVHHRHAESMPELAPYVDDATTWAVRSALYAELLAKPDTVLLLASAGDTLVGYGLAHVMPLEETWVGDTWVTGPRIGEIESLAVLPEQRGQGLGTGPRSPRARSPRRGRHRSRARPAARQRRRGATLRAPPLPPDLALPLTLRQLAEGERSRFQPRPPEPAGSARR